MKNGEIYHFWVFSGDLYRYTLDCTGTVWVLVVFGQPIPVQVRPVPVHPALF